MLFYSIEKYINCLLFLKEQLLGATIQLPEQQRQQRQQKMITDSLNKIVGSLAGSSSTTTTTTKTTTITRQLKETITGPDEAVSFFDLFICLRPTNQTFCAVY